MHQATKILTAATVITSMSVAAVSNAASFTYQRMPLATQVDQIRFGNFVLAPMGHVRFCLQHAEDCRAGKVDFRRRHIALTVERWTELNRINREVNRDIIPNPTLGRATEEWKISPKSGNCHDYAVTKRHELLAEGWPARDLLLAEVVIPSGEHHLILVVRTKNVDLVLDNLNADIRTPAMTRFQYRWVRIESPYKPRFWSAVTVPGPVRVAMVSDHVHDN